MMPALGEGNGSSQKRGMTWWEMYEEEPAILGRSEGKYQMKDRMKEGGWKCIFLTCYKNDGQFLWKSRPKKRERTGSLKSRKGCFTSSS